MEPRIGVYVCHCGSNIAGTVDVEEVARFAESLDGVVVARDYKFMCSDPGQELIKNDIRELGVNRVVVASCSPTMHEPTFRRACQEAGLNPYLFEMANIREHCSWVTEDGEKATEKAKALVSAAVNRVYYHQPLESKEVPVNPNTLVVGGGIAGIQAALKVADSEHKVYLVEKSPSIGGHMAQLDKTFPTLDCSACILTPKMTLVGSHPYIELMTYSEVEEVSGYVGNFKVKIRKKARYVDENKCTGCGECFNNCPVRYMPQVNTINFDQKDEIIETKMNEITLEIDGRQVKAKEGMTILEAAKSMGIDIPTLCYHPALSPFGGCRLCSAEITSRGRSRIVTSCNYPVEEGLVVNTQSPRVIEIRKMVSELLLARCPNVEVIQELAREYGVEKPRFKLEDEKCIFCGLCTRICEERIGVSAIGFVGRGVDRKVEAPFQRTLDSNLDVCMACGACVFVCPTGAIKLEDITKKNPMPILSEFEQGLKSRAPIYIPFPQAVPNVPVIDRETCVHFATGECKICEEFCEAKAINFEQEDELVEVEVGSIIVATGFSQFDPTPIYQYGYGRLDNVITGLEFERLVNSAGPTEGEIVLKDGSHPESIGIIHCVGSRDEKYHEYCSRVCCMHSIKFAHLLKEHTDAEVYEFYIDIRSFGKGYEEFYNRVLNEGTIFIRGRPAEITDIAETPEEEGKLIIQFEDTLIGIQRRLPVDMVILSCALEPQPDAEAIARLFNISRGADGFLLEKHPKLEPVSTMTDGIFLAGCCQGPKDIPDTVAQASAAAAEALAMISKGRVEIEAATAIIDERICTGCRLCELVCPYSGAVSFDEEKGVCRVNEALCKGCGACVGGCPSHAISLNHYTNEQIVAEMEGALV